MNRYFCKLKININQTDIDSISPTLADYYGNQEQGLLEMYTLAQPDQDLMLKFVPTSIKKLITKVQVMYITNGLQPHRDTGVAHINYYASTQNATTIFWKSASEKNIQLANSSNTTRSIKIYDRQDLNEECRFTANINECYLFNSQEIHSVELPDNQSKTEPRMLIQFVFAPGTPYETLYQHLLDSELI